MKALRVLLGVSLMCAALQAEVRVLLQPMEVDDQMALLRHITSWYANSIVQSAECASKEAALAEAEKKVAQCLDAYSDESYSIVDASSKEPVGTVWYLEDTENHMLYLGALEMKEDYRRQGYATATMREIIEKAKSAGFTTIQANVFNFNEASLELFGKKLGASLTPNPDHPNTRTKVVLSLS